MELIVLGSGSSGNCYVLRDSSGKMLLLECGIPYSEIEKGIDYRPSDVLACIITHEHKDHCKAAKDLETNGIRVFANHKTSEAIGIEKHVDEGYESIHIIGNPGRNYKIIPFETFHNAVDPCGYYIYHPEMGYLVFATDTSMITTEFEKVNHWLIESNYVESELEKNVKEGIVNKFQYDKTKTHLSVDEAAEVVNRHNKKDVRNVILCHLSKSNAMDFKITDYFSMKVGIKPYIAEKGLKLKL